MKRFLLWTMVMGIFLCSCIQQGKKQSEVKDVEEIKLTSVKYDKEQIISFPRTLALLENNLMLVFTQGDEFVKLYDKSDLSFKSAWGKFGNGPGEFISPQYGGLLKKGSETRLYLYDFNLRTLREYLMEERNRLKLLSSKRMKDKEVYVTNLYALNEKYFLGCAVFGADAPIVLMDKDLNIISNFGNLKERPKNGLGSQSYVGNFASDGNRFVYAMNDFGYLACYEEENGEIKQKWTHYMEKPLFDGYGSLDRKRLLDGFTDVTIHGDKVYAVYNGKSDSEKKDMGGERYPTLILAFDIHTGALCEKYRTDRDICNFVIDPDGTIYGVGVNPEVEVVKYKL
ncbi:BF3164 family lipoprotein [Phocaeicola coprophilus]|jgi:hypothetical protein|uniref:BF3164 family lipoprotein n=1 Tax=Phocaeicola coprophilus TaxID=387090 RepID=UPI0026DF8D3F|nr:BF3164 family lipoprotein [Phocaeicola coprophilus]